MVQLLLQTTMKQFKVGDYVTWNTEAGYASGTIIKIHISDFDYKGYTHHALKNEPQYEIKVTKQTILLRTKVQR